MQQSTRLVLSTCCPRAVTKGQQRRVNNGQLRYTTAQAIRRSACIIWHGSEIPKLSTLKKDPLTWMGQGLWASPPYCVTSVMTPMSVGSGRHNEHDITPGSSKSSPSKN